MRGVLRLARAKPARSFLLLLTDRQVAYSVSAVAMELRLAFLRALMCARWTYFTRQPLGRISNAFSAEATRSGQAYLFAASTVAAALEAAVALLIAPSGAGKTTIADLVLGLVRPDGGAVYVDGVEVGELDLHAWRSQVGYVPQEMFLLHDTVLRNVSLGDPALSRDDVEEALRRAGAWEFVARLPDGVDDVVGERGSLLSGGQRQRIQVARAIVHHPRLLILDEVTSSLDPETERRLWESVARLRGETTILAVSHQPTLASIADRVYHVEGGEVRLATPAAGAQRASAAN
jgi:ABC-type bacteriocin/lantibiotic exporter with double-glycine peptidase domain